MIRLNFTSTHRRHVLPIYMFTWTKSVRKIIWISVTYSDTEIYMHINDDDHAHHHVDKGYLIAVECIWIHSFLYICICLLFLSSCLIDCIRFTTLTQFFPLFITIIHYSLQTPPTFCINSLDSYTSAYTYLPLQTMSIKK